MGQPDKIRDSERIRLNQKVKFGSDESIKTDALSLNLSNSGIALKSYKTVTPGSKISLIIYSVDKPIRLDGVVVWNTSKDCRNEAEMGIRITSRKDNIKKLYQEYLHKSK